MRKILFIILVALSCLPMYAQQDYKGRVLDAKTNKSLPYVNIGIVNRGVGTVSDEEGLFHLELNKEDYGLRDSLQFSSIGYKTLKRAVKDLQFPYNEYPEIVLQPEIVKLNEIVVTNKGAYEIQEIIGYQNTGEKIYGYWKDNIALGGELATKIKVKKGLRKLEDLVFEVASNASDSLLVRINIYDEDGFKSFPGTNLNTSGKSIFHTIGKNARVSKVDLSPYDIYVKNDFILSLELLKIYGAKKVNLVLMAAPNKYTHSYRKYASLAAWEKLEKSAMAYQLNSTYYSDKPARNSKAMVAKGKKATNLNISGFVFFAGRGVSGATITNEMNGESTEANIQGRYVLKAQKGDLVTFKAPDMKTKRIKILDRTRVNINLESE